MAYRTSFEKGAQRNLVPRFHLGQGLQTSQTRERMFSHLFQQRKWPEDGWDDQTIEILINEISSMDSNNFLSKAGVGEREGRIFSDLVARRHFRLTHGIGRSGDLKEPQPKAAGSTLLSSLTNELVLDFLRMNVSKLTADAFILPMATGMSISLVLQTLKRQKPKASWVIWSRIDQKSCFKAISTAGLAPIVIEPILDGEELKTDLSRIEQSINKLGKEAILCVITTASCFAPRAFDDVEGVAKICKKTDIHHVVNNAYGVQSSKSCHIIDQANKVGRVDVYVQSTDKNLMVPVGGAIIAGFYNSIVDDIRQNYPGRASSSQTLDILITILSMGAQGYRLLLKKRKENFIYLKERMSAVAQKFNERILSTPHNNISIGMSLESLSKMKLQEDRLVDRSITALGSMLFRRNVHGARVVVPDELKEVDGFQFLGWGAHSSQYPVPYLTAAATIGMEKSEVDMFVEKLEECMSRIKRNDALVSKQMANDAQLEQQLDTEALIEQKMERLALIEQEIEMDVFQEPLSDSEPDAENKPSEVDTFRGYVSA